MLTLQKGKCYDKQHQFKQAALQYAIALEKAQEKGAENDLIGLIKFRLGWSIIRSRNNLIKGIDYLKSAHELLPTYTDLMVKLAGVLF